MKILGLNTICRVVILLCGVVGMSPHALISQPGTVAAWSQVSINIGTGASGLTGIQEISMGYSHCIALKSDGTVIGWGGNQFGQLNIPSGLNNVVAISSGKDHNLALKSDGTVVAWGATGSGRTTIPGGLNNVVAIAAGGYHSIAVRADGTVVAWGDNSNGQATVPGGLSDVYKVSAGYTHSLALTRSGTVVEWGSNIAMPSGLSGIQAIACGPDHSMAVKSDGSVVAWSSAYPVLGEVPAGLNNVVQVAGGQGFSLALKSDGSVISWGTPPSNTPTAFSQIASITADYRNAAVLSGPLVTVDRSQISAPLEGATENITISARPSNTVWQSTTASNWFSMSIVGAVLNLNISPNNTLTERSGVIQITGNAGTPVYQTIPVNQSGALAVLDVNAPLTAAGGSGSISITPSLPEQTWRVESNQSWITFSSTTGTGAQTLNLIVASNPGKTLRTAEIRLLNNTGSLLGTAVVNQSGTFVNLVANPGSFSAQGGSGTLNVYTDNHIAWHVEVPSTVNERLFITGSNSGQGNGSVTFQVSASNTNTVGMWPLNLRNSSNNSLLHSYSVQQTGAVVDLVLNSESSPASGGSFGGNISANSVQFASTLESSVNWLTITAPASGNGSRTFNYSIQPNTSSSSRSGNIRLRNSANQIVRNVLVTQQGAVFTVSPESLAAPAEGGAYSFQVQTDSGQFAWNATRNQNWIILQNSNGSGNGTVQFGIQPNTSAAGRTGRIAINGTVIYSIQQSGAAGSVSVSIDTGPIPVSGGTRTLSVTTTLFDAPWTIESPVWIFRSLNRNPYIGSQTMTLTFGANPGLAPRTGKLTVAGQEFSFTQSGTGGAFYEDLAAAPSSGNGWVNSPWLGMVHIEKFPWLYVGTLGWIRVQGTNPDDFWFYVPESGFGFGYTRKILYPHIYYARGQSWLYHTSGAYPVEFYDYRRSALRQIRDVVGVLSFTLSELRHTYTSPYLLDYNFKLTDQNGLPVVLDPSEFTIEPLENNQPISPSETGYQLLSADDKQLKIFLVLDYTRSIASLDYGDSDGDGVSDAIEEMEAAAKGFIDSLPDGTQLGIVEFHREDQNPNLVSRFSTRKDNLKAAIDGIWVDFVQMFPAASRTWDAVSAAIQEFGPSRSDEQRYVVFLSDGVDESSSNTPFSIISQAGNASVRIYSIGFGSELNDTALRQITQNTGGSYIEANSIESLNTAFDDIFQQLKGNYLLRWATLKRSGNQSFTPSFRIGHNGFQVSQDNLSIYNPTTYAGPVLEGELAIVYDTVVDSSSISTLRAAYVPRYIRQLRLNFLAAVGVQLSFERIAESNTGLIPDDWSMDVHDNGNGAYTVLFSSSNPNNINTSLPYASLGPILRIISTNITSPESLPYSPSIDNSIYSSTGGQSWSIAE